VLGNRGGKGETVCSEKPDAVCGGRQQERVLPWNVLILCSKKKTQLEKRGKERRRGKATGKRRTSAIIVRNPFKDTGKLDLWEDQVDINQVLGSEGGWVLGSEETNEMGY